MRTPRYYIASMSDTTDDSFFFWLPVRSIGCSAGIPSWSIVGQIAETGQPSNQLKALQQRLQVLCSESNLAV